MISFFNKYMKGDRVIWGIIIILFIFSILTVYSSTGMLAFKYRQGNTTYYLMRHLSLIAIGFSIIIIVSHLPYQLFSKIGQLLWIITIPLLLFTLIFGTSLNSASRWLTIPGLGMTMQTSDFAKIAIILYVARMLSLHQDSIKDFKNTFLPIIGPVTLMCLLILPANLSTSAMIFIICTLLMFIGRISFRQLLLLPLAGIILLGLFILIAPTIHMDKRLNTWKHRIENFSGSGEEEDNFQANQSKIAIVTGGVLGKGPGNSTQRNFIPHPYSDFIYAIIVEEYGLWGGTLVLILYVILFFRAGIIVRRCDRTFPAFLVMGLTLMLLSQAFINMAVAASLFPVTGQPLPLISMGGSSIMVSSVAFGMILGVSRSIAEAKEKEKEAKQKQREEEKANNTLITKEKALETVVMNG
jgi:cell division protein FtsW